LNSGGNGALKERAAITSLILASYALGYFTIGWATDPGRAHSLATPLDALIPFVPETIYIYVWLFTAMLFPLFVVRSPGLFRRVGLAYAAVVVVCLTVFAIYPVTAIGLRPGVGGLDASRFAGWGVKLVYTLDPPYNLFPSLHLAIATLAALSAWKAKPVYGAIGCAWVLPIAVSVSTLKQHFLVDSVAGAGLACAVYAAIIRPYDGARDGESAYGWGGPVLYLGFHLLFYVAAYAAFRAGADVPG